MNTINYVKCPRCDGTGIVPIYLHIQRGKCFLCGGEGRLEATIRVIAYGQNGVVNYLRNFFSKSHANNVVKQAKTYADNVAVVAFEGGIVKYTWNRA